MNISEHVCTHLNMFEQVEHIGTHLNMSVHIWAHPYTHWTWTHLNIFDHIWTCLRQLNICDHIWTHSWYIFHWSLNMSVHVLNLFKYAKLVKMCSNMQTCSEVHRTDSLKCIKWYHTCSDVVKHVQMCSNMFKCVKTCSNVLKHVQKY